MISSCVCRNLQLCSSLIPREIVEQSLEWDFIIIIYFIRERANVWIEYFCTEHALMFYTIPSGSYQPFTSLYTWFFEHSSYFFLCGRGFQNLKARPQLFATLTLFTKKKSALFFYNFLNIVCLLILTWFFKNNALISQWCLTTKSDIKFWKNRIISNYLRFWTKYFLYEMHY